MTKSQIRSALNRGKHVEQFLGACISPGGRAIQYLVLSLEESGVRVRLFASLDVGDENYVDIYSFPEANPDLEQGDAEAESICQELGSALELARELYGAAPDRYVNSGVSQDEYLDYVRTRGAG